MIYDMQDPMLEVCDCKTVCPCWIEEDPDNDTCRDTVVWHIERGMMDGIDVSGRAYAALARLPGNALQGN